MNRWRRILALAVLLVGLAHSASAAHSRDYSYLGMGILFSCEDEREAPEAACLAYISAVADALAIDDLVFKMPGRTGRTLRACVPDDLGVRDLRPVVVDCLNKNTDFLGISGVLVVAAALEDTLPCDQ